MDFFSALKTISKTNQITELTLKSLLLLVTA